MGCQDTLFVYEAVRLRAFVHLFVQCAALMVFMHSVAGTACGENAAGMIRYWRSVVKPP